MHCSSIAAPTTSSRSLNNCVHISSLCCCSYYTSVYSELEYVPIFVVVLFFSSGLIYLCFCYKPFLIYFWPIYPLFFSLFLYIPSMWQLYQGVSSSQSWTSTTTQCSVVDLSICQLVSMKISSTYTQEYNVFVWKWAYKVKMLVSYSIHCLLFSQDGGITSLK